MLLNNAKRHIKREALKYRFENISKKHEKHIKYFYEFKEPICGNMKKMMEAEMVMTLGLGESKLITANSYCTKNIIMKLN